RGRARAAVGLDDVAVDPDLDFAHRFEVRDRAQRAADQPLDFLRAAALLAAGGFAVGARVRRTRQHAILRGHPAATLAAHERRHAGLDARRAEDTSLAEGGEAGALGIAADARFEHDRAELVG